MLGFGFLFSELQKCAHYIPVKKNKHGTLSDLTSAAFVVTENANILNEEWAENSEETRDPHRN